MTHLETTEAKSELNWPPALQDLVRSLRHTCKSSYIKTRVEDPVEYLNIQ